VTDRDPVLAAALERLAPPVALEPDWSDVMARAAVVVPFRRRRRTWYAIAAVAALTAILVNPAFGIGNRLVDLFTGSPAPQPVKHELGLGNGVSDAEIGELMHQTAPPRVLVGRARGLMQVDTPAGPLRVWGAPTSDGGLCTYLWFVADIGEEPSGWLFCETLTAEADPLGPVLEPRQTQGRTVRLVYGQARADIASVELQLADGRTLRMRKSGPFYLRALSPGQQPAFVRGLDAAGRAIARTAVESGSLGGVLPPTLPTGPGRRLAELDTRIGAIVLESAPGPDGKRCFVVTGPASQSSSCVAVPRVVKFDFGPFFSPDQSERVVILAGLVGPRVRRLELRFEDATAVRIHLSGRFFVYDLPRRHWTTGRRPTVLAALAADGSVLGRRRLVPVGL
jgi:hypothetical protein